MGTAANQTKLQKCRNRWRNHQKGLEVTYKTVDMGASTMNPPKHRGSRCYIAIERHANPTKTNTVQRPRGKEKSSASDLVHRWRNPETYHRIDGATPKSKGDEPSRPWGVSKSERPAPSIRALWKRAEPSFLNLVYMSIHVFSL